MSRFTFLLLGTYLLQGVAWAQMPEEHFEKTVRPLLVERCLKCHGPETSRNNLRLDSYEGAIKGGKRGAAVVPNAPAESLLLKVVRRQGDLKMPPDGPLSPREISDLELWIKQGAIYPKSNKIVRGTAEHWSFQPIKQPSVPKVKNSSWVRNPIDAFILSKLETAVIGWMSHAIQIPTAWMKMLPMETLGAIAIMLSNLLIKMFPTTSLSASRLQAICFPSNQIPKNMPT